MPKIFSRRLDKVKKREDRKQAILQREQQKKEQKQAKCEKSVQEEMDEIMAGTRQMKRRWRPYPTRAEQNKQNPPKRKMRARWYENVEREYLGRKVDEALKLDELGFNGEIWAMTETIPHSNSEVLLRIFYWREGIEPVEFGVHLKIAKKEYGTCDKVADWIDDEYFDEFIIENGGQK